MRRLVDSDARIWLAVTLYGLAVTLYGLAVTLYGLAVTLYGLAAGIISYAATLSYEDNNIDGLVLVMNYPTFVVMISSGSISIPEYLYPLVIIGGSTAVWSFVSFIIYLFVWMSGLGP